MYKERTCVSFLEFSGFACKEQLLAEIQHVNGDLAFVFSVMFSSSTRISQ